MLIVTATGMNTCVYEVRITGSGSHSQVWIETPAVDGKANDADAVLEWELVEMKGVSEGG